MTREEIVRLTGETGGNWALNHVERLFRLVERISTGVPYDRDTMWYALYMHDWGAYGKFMIQGVDHALRSRDIAREVLPTTDLPPGKIDAVLYAIENHDYRNMSPVTTSEAILLRDADFLDFLGTIGLVRAFASAPRDLAKGRDVAISRRNYVKERLTLPASKEIAAVRLSRMDHFLALLEEESFGLR